MFQTRSPIVSDITPANTQASPAASVSGRPKKTKALLPSPVTTSGISQPLSIQGYLRMTQWAETPMDRNAMLIELAAAALSPRSRNHGDRFKLAAEVLQQIELNHLERTYVVACCLRVTRLLEKVAVRVDALPEERAFALNHLLEFQIQLVKNAVGQALKDRVFSGMFAALGLRLRQAETFADKLDCHFYRCYALNGQSDLTAADKMHRFTAEAERIAALVEETTTQSECQLVVLQLRCVVSMAAKLVAGEPRFLPAVARIRELLEGLGGERAVA
ncbi:hypothetical protein [Acanthopleuribacter pedis]|uniref:Uncharacterized protein n=1 Tax=Acanthopleuribacter pedis TaxID=442870 RepID=A0A8J7QAH0_9BACT|nr:hypothetical protein [Acanthopleuribacter pedis]MBO1321811.1 hypothetical protein [Acanthopleuribacter pedis]